MKNLFQVIYAICISLIMTNPVQSQQITDSLLFSYTQDESDFIISDAKAFSDNQLLLASNRRGQKFYIIQISPLKILKSIEIPSEIAMEGRVENRVHMNVGNPNDITIFNDRYLVSSLAGGIIYRYDMITREHLWKRLSGEDIGSELYGWSASKVDEQRVVVNYSKNTKKWLFDVKTFELIKEEQTEHQFYKLSDQNYFLDGVLSTNPWTLPVKQYPSGKEVMNVTYNPKPNDNYNFSHEIYKNYLLLNIYTEKQIYDINTGDLIFKQDQKCAYPPNQFIDDSYAIFGSCNGKFEIWDFKNSALKSEITMLQYVKFYKVAGDKLVLFGGDLEKEASILATVKIDQLIQEKPTTFQLPISSYKPEYQAKIKAINASAFLIYDDETLSDFDLIKDKGKYVLWNAVIGEGTAEKPSKMTKFIVELPKNEDLEMIQVTVTGSSREYRRFINVSMEERTLEFEIPSGCRTLTLTLKSRENGEYTNTLYSKTIDFECGD